MSQANKHMFYGVTPCEGTKTGRVAEALPCQCPPKEKITCLTQMPPARWSVQEMNDYSGRTPHQ